MSNYRDDLEIDLKDLFSYIIKHIRFIIIFMVIGCFLGTAFGIYKERKTIILGTQNDTSAEALLTSKEIYEVKSVVSTYTTYFDRYNEALEYKNNSPLMEIDGYNAPISQCIYVLSGYENAYISESNSVTNINNTTDKSIIDDIISLYIMEVNNEDTMGKIKVAMGSTLDDRYICEMYSIGKSGYSLMSVTAYGRTLDESMDILQQLMDVIDKKSDIVAKSIRHDIAVATITSNYRKAGYIISNKDSVTGQLKDLNNSMISVTGNLNANQKNYYTELMNESDNKYGIEKSEEKEKSYDIKRIIKYAIMGCVALAFAIVFIYSALYVVSPTIKTEDDLKHAFQLPVIGTVKDYDTDNLNIISSGICAVARTSSSPNIYIVSSYMDDNVESIKLKIMDKVQEKNVQIEKGLSLISDSETLDKVIASDGVVLVETIRKSRYEDIEKEIELCKNYNIKILGTVINAI